MNILASFLRNVLLKAAALFIILNLLFAWLNPMPTLGRLSLYNRIIPGRTRLPFGEEPDKAYNLSLFSLEAMFASHELSGTAKPVDEFRVLVFGDSSAWGFLLENPDTLTGQLNQAGLTTANNRHLRFYNLGYPTISLTKDLLLLDYAMQYDPDLIIWLVTLESFPNQKQLFTPLVQHNPAQIRPLIEQYHLNLDANDAALIDPDFWQRTILGQRRPLADLLRLQLYGPAWAATGIDQYIPASYTPRAEDLSAEQDYYGLQPTTLQTDDLAFDVLAAGIQRAAPVPVLIVNEPMFISTGENHEIRYNFFYPRWVYDAYRQLLAEQATQQGWPYLDLWQAVDNQEFTNSAIHITPSGSVQLANTLAPEILILANRQP